MAYRVLSDAGLLPDLLPQVIELRPAHPARPEDLDLSTRGEWTGNVRSTRPRGRWRAP